MVWSWSVLGARTLGVVLLAMASMAVPGCAESDAGELGRSRQRAEAETAADEDDDSEAGDVVNVRRTEREALAGVPFDEVPPPGRDALLMELELELGLGGTQAEVLARVNRVVERYSNGELILIDLLLTEKTLAGNERDEIALALGARGRVDVLRVLFENADAHARRLTVYNTMSEQFVEAVYQSWTYEVRLGALYGMVLAHTPEARVYLEQIAAADSADVHARELASEAADALRRW